MSKKLNMKEFEEESKEIVVSHVGYKCQKCGINPILGVMFKCCECQDVILCETCEKMQNSHSHIHAMVKIRKPNLNPFKEKEKVN